MEPEEIATGLTRRKMLKRVGAGAAIVWAAPALTTVGGHAFADVIGSPPCARCAVGDDDCGGQTDCGGGCTCLRTADRRCFCHQPISCGDPRVTACTTNAECPAGWACSFSCCVGGPLCHPPCGTTLGALTGATSVG